MRSTTDDPADLVRNEMVATAGPPRDGNDFDERRRRWAGLPTSEVDLAVDGEVVRFTRWDGPELWYAAARVGDNGLVVQARDLAPAEISLVPHTQGCRQPPLSSFELFHSRFRDCVREAGSGPSSYRRISRPDAARW